MKVRIQSSDALGCNARVTNAETGEDIHYVAAAEISLGATTEVTAKLFMVAPEIDVTCRAGHYVAIDGVVREVESITFRDGSRWLAPQ